MGVKLKCIDVCHGSRVVSNDFYIKHFEQQGKNVRHLLEDIMGRDKRYMFNENETTLSLAVQVSKSVLDKAELEGSDIDVLVYSSILSEYVSPPTSIILHKELNLKENVMCFDMNANCAGMGVALENISKYLMSSKHAKRALIVGCDDDNSLCDTNNEICYGNYGHASCAIILEKVDEYCGVIDTEYYINTSVCDKVLYPSNGFSSFFKTKNSDELYIKWTPFDTGVFMHPAVEIMTRLIKNAGLTESDISMFCLSQLALNNTQKIREFMNIEENKSIFIGDKYGYTGTTSPFIALYESIKQGKVKRGDYIVIWTFGAGSQSIAMLYKY